MVYGKYIIIKDEKKNIDQVVEEIPEDCDILHLFSHFNYEKDIVKKNTNDHGAVAYIVTEKGYNIIIDIFYENNIWTFKKNINLKNIIIDDGLKKTIISYKYSPSMIILSLENLYSTHIPDRFCGDKGYTELYYSIINYYNQKNGN